MIVIIPDHADRLRDFADNGEASGQVGMIREAADELDRLRAGILRIADGYGGDVTSLARNLLDGKV